MDLPNDAVTLPADLADEDLLTVEYDLPRVERDLEELAELERERYDEQIYAALVAPSF